MGGSSRGGTVLLVLASGCGRIGFDASGDAALDAPGPFSAPSPVTSIMVGSSNDDPALRGDQLEIVFTLVDACDVWAASRATTDDAWSNVAALAVINSPQCDSMASLSRDGLTMWLGTDRLGGNVDIFEAGRATLGSPWQAPVQVASLIAPTFEGGPTVTADGLTMLFYSYRGEASLYETVRATTGDAWGTPRMVSELDTGGEFSPHISSDGLTVYFTADQPGPSPDIFVATRAERTDPFDPATRIDEVSSAMLEDDPWVSDDGRHIYFARVDATGTRIYRADR